MIYQCNVRFYLQMTDLKAIIITANDVVNRKRTTFY